MIDAAHPDWLLLVLAGLVLVLLTLISLLSGNLRRRKNAEAALAKRNATLNLILDTIPQSVFWKDPNGRYLGCNHAFARAVGLDDPLQIVGRTDFDLPWPRDEAEAYRADDRDVLVSGQPRLHIIEPLQKADGTRLWIDTSKALLRDEHGHVFGVLGVYEDVTERIRAETALLESEEMQRKLLQAVPDLIIRTDMEGTITFVNEMAFPGMEHLPEESICGRNIFSFLSEHDLPRAREMAQQRIEKNIGPRQYQLLLDDILVDVEVNGAVIRDNKSSPVGMVYVIRDVSERKRSETALRESEERFRVLFDQAPDPLFIWRLDDTLQDINEAACRMLGYDREELLRLPLSKIQAPSVRKRNGGIIQDELRLGAFSSVDLRKDGTEVPVEIITVPIRLGGSEYALSAVRDITERKQAQQDREQLHAQLVQAQKMESVGILAGGIAHDFNNLLHAMRGNLELLAKAAALNSKSSERVRTVINALDRGANLVRQLLQFSRKVEPRKVRVDLNREVREAFRMLERTIPKMVALELRLDPSVWPISGDPTQIEQVLLNLAGNAVDAMPHGGALTIETRNAPLDEQSGAPHSASGSGRHVLLVVSDTGIGMDATTLKHVFDPFYTTKDVGKGTGLGLASAYGIVLAHGGSIQCSSEPGQGTTFRISLPAHDTDDPSATEQQINAITEGGTETILVVDDEPEILDLTREALEDFGYTVHTATKGEQALEVYRKQSQTIDLILLDLNMPGMGGQKCLQEFLRMDPTAKVIIASGYSANGQAEGVLSSGASGFLGKPFQLKELAAKLREVLDG